MIATHKGQRMSHAPIKLNERHWQLLAEAASATEPVRIENTTTRQDLMVLGLIRPDLRIGLWCVTREGLDALAERNQAADI